MSEEHVAKNRIHFWTPRILLGVVLAYGLVLRLSAVLEDPNFAYPDAERHFFAAGEIVLNEPTSWLAVPRGYLPFAWWNRIFFSLTFHHPLAQRLGTVVLSMALIVLVSVIVGSRLGAWPGVFAAYLMASSPPLILSAASGIRTDMTMCFWVGVYFFLFRRKPDSGRDTQRWLLASFLAWLLYLTRVDTILALVLVFGYAFLSQKSYKQWKGPASGGLLFVVLMGLVLAANQARYDDPFHYVDREKNTLRYWANLEFAGEPGFPSAEEVEAFSRTGEPIPASEYFGSVLGWYETGSRFYRGYQSLFLGNVATGVYTFEGFPNQIGLVGGLTLVGLGLSIWKRRLAIPLLIPLVVVSGIWTYHIPGGREFRFFLPVIPFAVLAATEGAAWLWVRSPGLRYPALKNLLRVGATILVLVNPWNHDLARSFPWRVGPVAGVPNSAQRDPIRFGKHVSLEGWELRKIGPFGLWESSFEELTAGDRFRVRLFWRSEPRILDPGTYSVALQQKDSGLFGTIRPRSLRPAPSLSNRDSALSFGQPWIDEFEYLVYPRVPSGPTSLILKVESTDLTHEATKTLTVFPVNPLGWALIDPRNWG